MVVKSTILAALAAASVLSLAVPAAAGLRVTLSMGAVSLAYDGTAGFDLDLDPACFATQCPLARLRFDRAAPVTTDAPPLYRASLNA
jgi:hypothetical protein